MSCWEVVVAKLAEWSTPKDPGLIPAINNFAINICLLVNVEKTKINKKGPGTVHFLQSRL